MSLRSARTLSRLFQARVGTSAEKSLRYSSNLESTIPVDFDKDFVFEPEFLATEQERILDYHAKLVFKDGEFLDMDLLDAKRRLLCGGKLFRQSESAFGKGQVELRVLLFDNYLVMARLIGKRSDTKLQIYKRPIPLDLLTLKRSENSPSRVRRRSSLFFGQDDRTKPYLSTLGAQGITDNYQGPFPITIIHEGRLGSSYTLYADTAETRLMWESKLEEAIQLRRQSSRVFRMKILNQESFLMRSGVSSGYLPQGREFTRTINCITPFTTRDGRSLMAIGCVEGLWIGNMHDSQSFHRVLPLQMVRQCAVLEDFAIILILTENDLCAYDLESCVPTSTGLTSHHSPRKLSSKGNVLFFRVGMIDGDTYVVFSRRKRTDTNFRMLKVVRPVEQESALTPPNVKEEWFRVHREFLLPVYCTDVVFLPRSLFILHRNGFNMLNLSNFQCSDMPLLAERSTVDRNLKKRISCQSLGIFRLETGNFLLSYDKLGVYVDRHGTLIANRGAVEWEGVVKRVCYRHPYVLLFSNDFVEIRHAVSGRLEQIIRGSLRYLWDGDDHGGGNSDTGQLHQDAGVIGMTVTPAGLDELAVQCIFTLVSSE